MITRPIKFRAKDKKTGDWMYWDVFMNPPIGIIQKTIGQYIGSCDIKKSPIYEWDILSDGNKKLVIVYLKDQMKFVGVRIQFVKDRFRILDGPSVNEKNCKIIGDFFNNPELLKRAPDIITPA